MELPDSWYRNFGTAYLGFPFPSFYSTDYFSLFPWYFLFLAGYFFKQILSSKDVMKHLMPSKIMTLEWIGAHSLEIYIIHQPLIYVVLLALDQVSFDVQAGEFISIMGASGSGKTTLLNCISTIDTVSAGHILLDGRDITTIDENDIAAFRRDYLGFVFQDFNLLDTLTLEENIALPLTISGTSPKEIDERVQRIADKLHISDILKKYPIQVSGGQKQRCAFARAVICNPKLIMADEPTGALDSNSSRILLEMMSDFKGEMGSTILMVTHDAFSASYAERILFLRDGRIFNEIFKGEKTRSVFYHEILDVLSLLGGEKPC